MPRVLSDFMLDHVPVKVVETPIWKMILPPGRDLGPIWATVSLYYWKILLSGQKTPPRPALKVTVCGHYACDVGSELYHLCSRGRLAGLLCDFGHGAGSQR